MRGQIARRAVPCLCLSLLATSALAQTASSEAQTIELADALSRTLAENLDLLAFGYQIEAAEARVQQASLAPNPELGVSMQDVVGSGAYRGVDSAETTVTLGWILEHGVRQRIVDAARAGASVRTLDTEIVRLDAAAETARRFLDCLAYQGRLRNAEQAVALAQDTVRLIAERVNAGLSLEADLARAQANLARSELLEEDYEHELLSAYHRLSAQWGETQPRFSSVSGSVGTLPELQPFETFLAQLDGNPELARFMSQQRREEAELRLAQARSRPSWQVAAGVRRFESTDDFALLGNLTVPLPIRNRNQGRIAEVRADVARTHAETAASRVRIETLLFVLYQELNHNLQVAARLSADVIPRIERALEDTRRAYELGRYDYSQWRIVQEELLEAGNDLLEASVDAHRIVIEIERLTGARVAPPAASQ